MVVQFRVVLFVIKVFYLSCVSHLKDNFCKFMAMAIFWKIYIEIYKLLAVIASMYLYLHFLNFFTILTQRKLFHFENFLL